MAAPKKTVAKKPVKRRKRKSTFVMPKPPKPILKGKILVILACAHSITTDARPNPRKDWPDAQMCEVCKRKKRVVYIKSVKEGKNDAE